MADQGQTIENVRPLAMVHFEKAMQNQWNRSCPITTALSQHGSEEMETDTLTSKFSITGRTGSPTRHYGTSLPAQFARCTDAPDYAVAEVDMVWSVAPGRIRFDLKQLKGGFMGNPVQHTLDNLNQDLKFESERLLCGGIGDAVLFDLNGPGVDNGDGTFTYPVVNYGGLPGQLLGRLMKSMLLEGAFIQAASAVGAASGNLTAVEIVSVDDTPGVETITTEGDLGGGGATAAGWVVYRSREDDAGVQTLGDAHVGFPYLISDWTDFATVQGVTAADAPRFEAEVIRSPGVPLPLNEGLFTRLISLCEVAQPVENADGGVPTMNGFFFTHTFNVNAFALSLLQDRRYMSPPIKNAGAAGYAKRYLTMNGLPIADGQLGQRNSLYYAIADRLYWRKNGPLMGQFMVVGGQSRFSIPCSPDEEVRWVACRQLAAHGRAGMGRVDNLDPALPEAA